jgi:hypothetical protein
MVFMMPCWIAAEFLVDGHAEGKGARADKEQEAGPRRHYSIIRGTLCWTHSTLTYLPSGTGCLAASRIPYWRHIKRNSVRSGASAIFLQSVVPIEQSKTSALSIFFHHASSHSFQKIAHKFHISDASTRVARLNASLILSSVGFRPTAVVGRLFQDRRPCSRPAPFLHLALGTHKRPRGPSR